MYREHVEVCDAVVAILLIYRVVLHQSGLIPDGSRTHPHPSRLAGCPHHGHAAVPYDAPCRKGYRAMWGTLLYGFTSQKPATLSWGRAALHPSAGAARRGLAPPCGSAQRRRGVHGAANLVPAHGDGPRSSPANRRHIARSQAAAHVSAFSGGWANVRLGRAARVARAAGAAERAA